MDSDMGSPVRREEGEVGCCFGPNLSHLGAANFVNRSEVFDLYMQPSPPLQLCIYIIHMYVYLAKQLHTHTQAACYARLLSLTGWQRRVFTLNALNY